MHVSLVWRKKHCVVNLRIVKELKMIGWTSADFYILDCTLTGATINENLVLIIPWREQQKTCYLEVIYWIECTFASGIGMMEYSKDILLIFYEKS